MTAPLVWRRSSFCNGASSCVEVACTGGEVLVRDSKLGKESPVLRWTASEWALFVDALRFGQLGTYGGPVLLVAASLNCWQMWRDGAPWVALTFDDAEVDAFVAGVEAGEFEVASLASGMDGSDGDARTRVSDDPVARVEASPVSQ